MSQKEIEQTVRYLKRAVEIDRANTEIRTRLAMSYEKLGIVREATNEYKILAQLTRENEDYVAAQSFYTKIISFFSVFQKVSCT